jgi:hypothetical protein
MHIIMATPLYNNNTDPIIIPDNLLFYHIPISTVSSWQRAAEYGRLEPGKVGRVYQQRRGLEMDGWRAGANNPVRQCLV